MGASRKSDLLLHRGRLPQNQTKYFHFQGVGLWCERGDSNPHGFTRQILSLFFARAPTGKQEHDLTKSTGCGFTESITAHQRAHKYKTDSHQNSHRTEQLTLNL